MKNMKAEGYRHIWHMPYSEHILLDTNTGNYEIWFANKNHAGYGLNYKNTHLEFARSVSADDARNFAINWQEWASGNSISYGELAEWAAHFEALGKKFNLTDEFKENGIL